jgi:hypothetical protein
VETDVEVLSSEDQQDEEQTVESQLLPIVSKQNSSSVYFENALSRVPAFDIGGGHSKLGNRLEFLWPIVDPNGKPSQAQCHVDFVEVDVGNGVVIRKLPGDLEHDLLLFIIDRYSKDHGVDRETGTITFGYKDFGKFIGYSNAGIRSGKFREAVKNAVRTLAKAKIVTRNAWQVGESTKFEKESIVSYIEHYTLVEKKELGDIGRGHRDEIQVLLGSHFRRNISSRFLSVIASEVFPRLKGSSALRRLAHIVVSRADEAGNPPILFIHLSDIRIAMAIPDKVSSFRTREKLNRLWKGLVRAEVLSETPTYRQDSNEKEVVVLKLIYHVRERPQFDDVTVDRFIRSLARHRGFVVPDCGIKKAEIPKLDVGTYGLGVVEG